ncbi:60S ribosome subunit biogenesis protein NIP7 homolog isoform X1 [Phyllostomus discolor]|uniref:60S ribosome subunit biogenesis protein NIP7 homolog n=1 Tax=Phyllostomus discolor TaxID=89673 RepID=A0A7E6CPC5_9CHIR|nr:60S ribosome subunit biogenesis protein NIP7 homolog isoform X1 [Phyllostomus discolor]
MRPLTEEETRVMFEKIAKYIGENLQLLIDRPDGTYCFRLHNDRVYYVSEKILKLAANISGDKLVSLGTCFGKFTKTHKFRLHVTALDYLAPYAKYKVWVKPGAEQSFLYGNHVLKSGLGRITENTSQYQGVVVYSMADIPLEKNKITGHLGMLRKMYGLLCMLKTKDKQSKNENIVSSFLAIEGENAKSFSSSMGCRKGGSRKTKMNESKQEIKTKKVKIILN